MKEFSYKVVDELGIHARPAALFVNQAKRFSSSITLSAKGKECDVKSILAVMKMVIKQGDQIKVRVEGNDEDEAVAVLETFVKEHF